MATVCRCYVAEVDGEEVGHGDTTITSAINMSETADAVRASLDGGLTVCPPSDSRVEIRVGIHAPDTAMEPLGAPFFTAVETAAEQLQTIGRTVLGALSSMLSARPFRDPTMTTTDADRRPEGVTEFDTPTEVGRKIGMSCDG